MTDTAAGEDKDPDIELFVKVGNHACVVLMKLVHVASRL